MTNLNLPKQRAVFLDRDGVINEERGYAHRLEDLALVPGASSAIQLINEHGLLAIVVSNQAGIAYGYYEEKDMRRFNWALAEELNRHGARIDAFYFCPHHETKGAGEYKRACECRKPKCGLLLLAAKDFGIDLSKSFMIGDTWSDIMTGKNAGCKTILVKTGHDTEELTKKPEFGRQCDFIADDLGAAARYILGF